MLGLCLEHHSMNLLDAIDREVGGIETLPSLMGFGKVLIISMHWDITSPECNEGSSLWRVLHENFS
jgi:hypothetical protein